MGAKPTIAQNVGLLTAANLLMRGVSMLFQVYLTARVGAAGVGLLQLILSVNLFAVTLGTSGLRVAALYLSAEAYGLRRYGGVRQAMVWCLTAGLLLTRKKRAAREQMSNVSGLFLQQHPARRMGAAFDDGNQRK